MIYNVITKALKNTKKIKKFFYRDFYGKKNTEILRRF